MFRVRQSVILAYHGSEGAEVVLDFEHSHLSVKHHSELGVVGATGQSTNRSGNSRAM